MVCLQKVAGTYTEPPNVMMLLTDPHETLGMGWFQNDTLGIRQITSVYDRRYLFNKDNASRNFKFGG